MLFLLGKNRHPYQVTSNSVIIAWDAVPNEQLRGKLVGYRVQYKSSQSGFDQTSTKNIDQIEEAELLDLKPATQYQITVGDLEKFELFSRKFYVKIEDDPLL